MKYGHMAGVKMTLLLPLIDLQIKKAIKSEEKMITYSLILCNTNSRCKQLAEFAKELSSFCSEIIDFVYFEHLDWHDVKYEWKLKTEMSEEE